MNSINNTFKTIILISSLSNGTGNSILASRLKYIFEKGNHKIILYDSNNDNIENLKNLVNCLQNENLYIIGIHAFRSGNLILQLNKEIPYSLIFGGTDLNETYKNEEKMKIMNKTVDGAKNLFCLSEEMKSKATLLWPNQIDKMVIAQPSIVPIVSENKEIESIMSFNHLFKSKLLVSSSATTTKNNVIVDNSTLKIILPIGIRPIKDPLFILKSFSDWSINFKQHINNNSNSNSRFTNVILLIIGPSLDEKLMKELLNCIENQFSNIYYHPSIPHNQLLQLIKESDILANSSINEGLCTTIMEAMYLETFTIARDNGGNRHLITNQSNGLLFSTPEEFIQCLDYFIKNNSKSSSNIREMISNAKQIFDKKYSLINETNIYLSHL